MNDDLETRLAALLGTSTPDTDAIARARAAATSRPVRVTSRPGRGWRLAVAVGLPALAVAFVAMIVTRNDSAAPASSPGERVAANLGWGRRFGITHIRTHIVGATDGRSVVGGESWELNGPSGGLASARRGRMSEAPSVIDVVQTTQSDGTATRMLATGAPDDLTISISPDQRDNRTSITPDEPPYSRAFADGALRPDPTHKAGSATLVFTGGPELLVPVGSGATATVAGRGPAVRIEVDTSDWIPTKVTIAPLLVSSKGQRPQAQPGYVQIWDTVEQLPSDGATVAGVFDLRKVYPTATVTDGSLGSPDSSSGGGSDDPVQVVRMYVAALNAGNVEFAKSLGTPAFVRHADSSQDCWFHQAVHLGITTVGAVQKLRPREVGMPDGTEIVYVPVELDVRQQRPLSISNGALTWGYRLVRSAKDGSWLIADEGVG